LKFTRWEGVVAKKPSLRRRRVVAALKRLREEAGLTMAQVVEKTDISQSKLSRIETLEIGITGDDTRTLCEAYGVDKETTDALAELARQGRRRGWWHIYSGDVLLKFVDFVELETDARAVNSFQTDLIFGLLQTERYAEAVIRHGDPTASDETIAGRVELRMARQERWHKGGFELWSIVDESALRRPIGGAKVMAEQLDHLTTMAAHPKITLQVLPINISGHMALGVQYTIIKLIDKATFVNLETLTGGLYLEDEPDVHRYNMAWNRLSATALDFDRSVALIKRIAGEHRSGHG
jgi:transcriptional regulator with XRE-family HTH domain